VLLLALIGVFNYLIDPYGIFNMPRYSWLNETKATAATKVRIAKPYQVTDMTPKTIIMGNSRPEMGLSPNSSCWDNSMKPIFNLAIPGLGFYAQTRLLQHALENPEIRRVYFGIDFFDFIVNADAKKPMSWPPHASSFENRLLVNLDGEENNQHLSQSVKDKLLSLFTLNSLIDSIKTIITQGDQSLTTRTRNGFNPAQAYYQKIIKNEGQWVLFEQKNKEVFRTLTKNRYSIYREKSGTSESFEALKMIKAILVKREIDAYFFINPYHTDYLESIKKSGNTELFQQWKREITKILGKQPALPLYDFSESSSYILEQPPQKSNRKNELAWFWEPAHYKQELGDIMLSQMLKTNCTPHPQFGKPLVVAQ
jgi:hypothetical protein